MAAMAKPTLKPDDLEQSKRFIEIAEELETDSSPEEFDRVFAKVAAAKRQPATKSQAKRKKR
jgi:hypothetical protein